MGGGPIKKAPTKLLAPLDEMIFLVVEYSKTTTKDWDDIATAESYGAVCSISRIGKKIWTIVLRVDDIVGYADRIIAWNRESDDLINAYRCAFDGLVESLDESSCVGSFGAFPDGRLLHGMADFAKPCEFSHVSNTTAKFFTRTGTSAHQHHRSYSCQ